MKISTESTFKDSKSVTYTQFLDIGGLTWLTQGELEVLMQHYRQEY